MKSTDNYKTFTDNGMYFDTLFSAKTKGKSLHNGTCDFMSSPRQALGIYIKDKLIEAGAMKFGELVTDEVLDLYGKREILAKVYPGNKLYLEF